MCIIDCLSTIVFILPLHLDYTKVIILILWWRNFQLEYWRTFQLVSTLNGKRISKTVKSKGKPWYQNIAYNAALTLNNGKSLEYECFRPDNIKLYTMSAVKKGIENFDGRNTVKIEVSLTGFMSAFWSCDYYFATTTLEFVGYKGINGGPGTPETIISVSR